MAYVGRFAPSPTGPLHLGSLVAAVASYCDAKSRHGQWLVRMEDLDKPRELAGAAKTILNSLEAYGFEWDGEIMAQSQRASAYQAAFETLQHSHLVYPCTCSRREVADSNAKRGIEGTIYPRTCLHQPIKPNSASTWRIKTGDKTITFEDLIQGFQSQQLSNDIGDFVLKRADGFFTYQLAVVVDDASQGVTHIVRGADLLSSTQRQIYLQQKLKLPTPIYAHIPVVINAQAKKLSKQTHAAAISNQEVIPTLHQAFQLLKLQPPKDCLNASIADNWQWAFKQWHSKYSS